MSGWIPFLVTYVVAFIAGALVGRSLRKKGKL